MAGRITARENRYAGVCSHAAMAGDQRAPALHAATPTKPADDQDVVMTLVRQPVSAR